MAEFTEKQIQRIDEVCNITIEFLEKLLDIEITDEIRSILNNAAVWCEVADFATDILYDHNLNAHFPTHVEGDGGEEIIQEYFGKDPE